MLSDTAGSYWSTRGGTTPRQAKSNAEELVPDVAISVRVNCRSDMFSQDTSAEFWVQRRSVHRIGKRLFYALMLQVCRLSCSICPCQHRVYCMSWAWLCPTAAMTPGGNSRIQDLIWRLTDSQLELKAHVAMRR